MLWPPVRAPRGSLLSCTTNFDAAHCPASTSMTYEYSSESKRLEFPNPYRVENQFYFLAAPILCVGGVGLLLVSRGQLSQHASLWAFTPFAIGVFLLLRGLVYASQAMSRLRFFFGRGQPLGLAQELTVDQVGKTAEADALKEKLRQNSLFFREPTGPLNGLLYSLVCMILSSADAHPVRRTTAIPERPGHAGNAAQSAVFGAGSSQGPAAGWLAIFYFVFTLVLLLKPLDDGAAAQTSLSLSGLVVLILTAILGPVVIPLLVGQHAAPDWVPGLGETALILLFAIAAVLLFFLAVVHQTLRTPPAANMSVKQDTLSMNAHPKQLLDELERELQAGWTESVPNRRYAKIVPDVLLNAESGAFSGELIEETQPLPRDDLRTMGLLGCFSDERYRWLGWLNAYGVVMMSLAVLLLMTFAKVFRATELSSGVIAFGALGIATFIIGNFCFRAGNVLWGRFDFISELYWIEMSGTYQAARLDYGNQFGDRVRTQKQVINIETMTLRVWVAQLETVSFGKDSVRAILGMRGLPTVPITCIAI